MNRRQAIKTAAFAGVLAALPRLTANVRADAPAAAAPAAGGSFKHSVCQWCCKMPLEALAVEGKKIGLDSIELLQIKDIPVVQKHGLACAVAFGPKEHGIANGFNKRSNHEKHIPLFNEAIVKCGELGVPSIICFSGNRIKGQTDEEGLEACAEALKQIMPAAEKAGVTVVMELLNSKINHKGYLCDRTPWGVQLVKKVGSERFKLLYDIYHMQVMEGDVINTIRQNHKYIGHYHTAGNPGRNEFEPQDVQELNYAAIMKAIHDTGYRGYVGQEFIPKRKLLVSLANAIKICTVS